MRKYGGGETAPSAEVLIEGSWGEKAETFSDSIGKWKANIKTPRAGGPHQIVISSERETITLIDVMIGKAWLCSGQSNMEMPLKGFLPNEPIEGSEETIKSADFPRIRMFTVKRNLATSPQEYFEGEWAVCSPKTAGEFSAVAIYFGRKSHQDIDVPIGLIHSSWGGTPAESWTALNELKNVSGFEK